MNDEQPYFTRALPLCPQCGGLLKLAQGSHTKKYFALHKNAPAPYHHFDTAATVDGAIAAINHPHTVDVSGIVSGAVPEQKKKTGKRSKKSRIDSH